jgi:hypothetical protein
VRALSGKEGGTWRRLTIPRQTSQGRNLKSSAIGAYLPYLPCNKSTHMQCKAEHRAHLPRHRIPSSNFAQRWGDLTRRSDEYGPRTRRNTNTNQSASTVSALHVFVIKRTYHTRDVRCYSELLESTSSNYPSPSRTSLSSPVHDSSIPAIHFPTSIPFTIHHPTSVSTIKTTETFFIFPSQISITMEYPASTTTKASDPLQIRP